MRCRGRLWRLAESLPKGPPSFGTILVWAEQVLVLDLGLLEPEDDLTKFTQWNQQSETTRDIRRRGLRIALKRQELLF